MGLQKDMEGMAGLIDEANACIFTAGESIFHQTVSSSMYRHVMNIDCPKTTRKAEHSLIKKVLSCVVSITSFP